MTVSLSHSNCLERLVSVFEHVLYPALSQYKTPYLVGFRTISSLEY